MVWVTIILALRLIPSLTDSLFSGEFWAVFVLRSFFLWVTVAMTTCDALHRHCCLFVWLGFCCCLLLSWFEGLMCIINQTQNNKQKRRWEKKKKHSHVGTVIVEDDHDHNHFFFISMITRWRDCRGWFFVVLFLKFNLSFCALFGSSALSGFSPFFLDLLSFPTTSSPPPWTKANLSSLSFSSLLFSPSSRLFQ